MEPCRHELDGPDQGEDEDRELVEQEEREVEVHRAAEPLLVVHRRPVIDGLVPAGRVHLEMHALQGDAEVLADQGIGMEEERRVEDAHDRDHENEQRAGGRPSTAAGE